MRVSKWFIQLCIFHYIFTTSAQNQREQTVALKPQYGFGSGVVFGRNGSTPAPRNATRTSTALPLMPHHQRPNRTRIVGGEETKRNEYPFIVSLQRHGMHFCGASIIDAEWVLTAAHCVTEPDFSLTAGEHDLNQREGSEQIVWSKKVIRHPQYNPLTYEDDIALVKVAPPFVFTPKIQSFKLPNVHFVATGNVTTAGWGVVEEGSNVVSPVLRKVTIGLFSNMECAQMYGKEFISLKMICAGEEIGGKDACQGDSGGPLLCDDHFKGATLCGVVSFGFGCARKDFAGVYTKVSYYADWIGWVQGIDKNPGDKNIWTTPKHTDPDPITSTTIRPRFSKRPSRKEKGAAASNNSSVLFLLSLCALAFFYNANNLS